MPILKILAVLSALGFIACVVAAGAGDRLSSSKFGALHTASVNALEGEAVAGKADKHPKDAGAPPPPVYINSTKAGPLPLPREETQQQAPQPTPQQAPRPSN